MSYFERVDDHRFRATEHVGGAWEIEHQHIAPAIGLLAHVVERDRDARRDDGLVVARLSYDILGTLPVDDVETFVRVLRPGRTVELVEARLCHDGRDALVLRAWLVQPRDTSAIAGTDAPPIPSPEELEPWDAAGWWPGGFIASVEVRRTQRAPGRGTVWVRTAHGLVADEPVSTLAASVGLYDIANGMSTRVDPREVAFPNLDLTAHLYRTPRSDWVGFDTTVSFGAEGIGLTSSVLHDLHGPVGTLDQVLTIRPG